MHAPDFLHDSLVQAPRCLELCSPVCLSAVLTLPDNPTHRATCRRYVQRGENNEQATGEGAAINFHLAASLALQQSLTAPVAEASCVDADGADLFITRARAPHKSPVLKQDAAFAAPSAAKERLVDWVDGAVRQSVIATELSNTPVVGIVTGLLDTEATQTRERVLAGAVAIRGEGE